MNPPGKKKTCSRRVQKALLDLGQPSNRRCALKTGEMGPWGEAPGGRLWRTAVDPHMGRGRAGACGTQMRQRQAKKGSFGPIIFIWRMREPGVWES